MESLNENLDFDPSEGQDWNWEDFEQLLSLTISETKKAYEFF